MNFKTKITLVWLHICYLCTTLYPNCANDIVKVSTGHVLVKTQVVQLNQTLTTMLIHITVCLCRFVSINVNVMINVSSSLLYVKLQDLVSAK